MDKILNVNNQKVSNDRDENKLQSTFEYKVINLTEYDRLLETGA